MREPFPRFARSNYEKISCQFFMLFRQEKDMAHRCCIPILCLPLLILLVSCSSALETGGSSGSSSPRPSQSSVSQPTTNPCNKAFANKAFGSTGNIIDIGSDTLISNQREPHLMVEGKMGNASREDRFLVHIDQQTTKIYDNRQQGCRTASLTDLQKGQHISIQSTGLVLQSYPEQIIATEIVILP
jgi:hypothetical protein